MYDVAAVCCLLLLSLLLWLLLPVAVCCCPVLLIGVAGLACFVLLVAWLLVVVWNVLWLTLV